MSPTAKNPLAYTPGVAELCSAIRDDYEKSYLLTRSGANMAAVITDGSAIPRPGRHRPGGGHAGDGRQMRACSRNSRAWTRSPLCVRTKDVDELVRTIYLISGSFGGINPGRHCRAALL